MEKPVLKPMTLFETDRTLLKTWKDDDAAEALRFYGDPLVSQFIGNGQAVQSIEQMEKILRIFSAHQKKFNISPWAVVEKGGSKILGICGLHRFNQKDEDELGFRILRSEWGRGIATEVAKGSVDMDSGNWV